MFYNNKDEWKNKFESLDLLSFQNDFANFGLDIFA